MTDPTIDYTRIFQELEQRGIAYDEKQKARFIEICNEKLKKHYGMLGTPETILHLIFGFLKNLVGGIDFENLITSFNAATGKTSDTNDLFRLNRTTQDIYLSLKNEGGPFAAAAELVSGQKMMAGRDNSGPVSIEGNLYSQLRPNIPLPAGTSTNLNRNERA